MVVWVMPDHLEVGSRYGHGGGTREYRSSCTSDAAERSPVEVISTGIGCATLLTQLQLGQEGSAGHGVEHVSAGRMSSCCQG